MRTSWRWSSLLFVLILLSQLGAVEGEGTPDGGLEGITLTPALVRHDLSDRRLTFTISVINEGDAERTVAISALELGHTLDGTPRLGEPVNGLDFEGPATFELAPGEVRTVEFFADFPAQVALYAGAVATLEPSDSGDIEVVTRAASLVMLRGPRPWDQTLADRGVGVDFDADEGAAQLFVDLENVGDAHIAPNGWFVVHQDDVEVARIALDSASIIPSYARRLTGSWVPPADMRGRIDITVMNEDGTELARGSADLADIAERVAEAQSGETSGGASFGGGSQPSIRAGAMVLLFLTVGLLLLTLKRRREDEEEEEVDEGAGREHVSAAVEE